ncbi:MAG: hypothetical protein V1798_09655 [Pseudomonadota bacterium]
MRLVFNGDGSRPVLGHLATSLVSFVEELAVSPVMPAHETREFSKLFKRVDLMGMVAHETDDMEGIFLLKQLLIEHIEIGPFFVGFREVPLPVMASPNLMKGETGIEKEIPRQSGHIRGLSNNGANDRSRLRDLADRSRYSDS